MGVWQIVYGWAVLSGAAISPMSRTGSPDRWRRRESYSGSTPFEVWSGAVYDLKTETFLSVHPLPLSFLHRCSAERGLSTGRTYGGLCEMGADVGGGLSGGMPCGRCCCVTSPSGMVWMGAASGVSGMVWCGVGDISGQISVTVTGRARGGITRGGLCSLL